MTAARDHAATVLGDLERTLDPGAPEKAPGLEVIGYGEVSACLRVAGLPTLVCKRMSGFADDAAAGRYGRLVTDYLDALRAGGVAVVDTSIVPVPRPGRPPVVYLVQPELDPATLGHRLLVSGDDDAVVSALDRVLATTLRLAVSNAGRTDGVEVALDGQLSNWSFDPAGGRAAEPVLVDVGTPFMRRGGGHLIDIGWLETPIPPVVRTYYHRRALVAAYIDDYFEPRTVAVDLLGNFHKEGRPDRIALGAQVVNAWLEADVAAHLGPQQPVTADEVTAYYRSDADLLALYLRLRRADRFLRTRLARKPYDFILPGHVQR